MQAAIAETNSKTLEMAISKAKVAEQARAESTIEQRRQECLAMSATMQATIEDLEGRLESEARGRQVADKAVLELRIKLATISADKANDENVQMQWQKDRARWESALHVETLAREMAEAACGQVQVELDAHLQAATDARNAAMCQVQAGAACMQGVALQAAGSPWKQPAVQIEASTSRSSSGPTRLASPMSPTPANTSTSTFCSLEHSTSMQSPAVLRSTSEANSTPTHAKRPGYVPVKAHATPGSHASDIGFSDECSTHGSSRLCILAQYGQSDCSRDCTHSPPQDLAALAAYTRREREKFEALSVQHRARMLELMTTSLPLSPCIPLQSMEWHLASVKQHVDAHRPSSDELRAAKPVPK